MEQIRKNRKILKISGLVLLLTVITQIVNANSFVLCPQIHQQPTNRSICVRFFGAELELKSGTPLLLPQMGKNPSAIIFGTKFSHKLCDNKTVRCMSRKPGRTDYLWYDIELVLKDQIDEEIANKEPRGYRWVITRRPLDQVPLRIPESAIIIYLPADFIAELVDEQVTNTAGTFYLPSFTLKKTVTAQQLEDYLDEADMRQLKDKRFFSNTTAVGTVPTAVQLLNS